MIQRIGAILVVLVLTGCAGQQDFRSDYASGHYLSEPEQCVPYARRVSGVEIRGDAHSWWNQASPRYKRGNRPEEGAVLVLSKTRKLPRGHLAVVKNIVNERQINVAHSNWGNDKKSRSVAYDSMRVEDISPKNDWTRLRFWNREVGSFGFPYAAKGFIYPN